MAKVFTEMLESPISNHKGGSNEFLDMKGLTTLLEEANKTVEGNGVEFNDRSFMSKIYSDPQTTNTYIESLAEGLAEEDIGMFKHLANNMVDCIMGRGDFSNRGSIMSMLTEDNISAGFMPKAKVLLPLFRFTWPRLHVREICTVMPMDTPEMIRVRRLAA